ncbi:MAG: cation diffusion facilitator family transporter [Defluviitaleaceae bacterium]|nr:cation diffusion facilitator family transporter [Defluviitaleaceae bacterium]
MIKLILKKADKKREFAGFASGVIGIFANLLLFGLKLAAGLVLGSVAVIADAFNNLTDTAASVITLVGFKVSQKPADKEHPFGHGRMEDVAALVIAMVILFLGLEFARSSISAILNPEPLNFSWLSVGLLAFSFFVKLWMFFFNGALGKRLKSAVLKNVATDSINDCIVMAFIIASIFVAHAWGWQVDGWAGLIVSAILLWSGGKALWEAASAIIGKPADKVVVRAIKDIVLTQEGVIDIHDLVVHNYGAGKNVATIHIEIDMNQTLQKSHDIADCVEHAVLAQLGIILTAHLDPVDVSDQNLHNLKKITKSYLYDHCPAAHAHEFKLEDGKLALELQLPHGLDDNVRKNVVDGLVNVLNNEDPGLCVEIAEEFGFLEDDCN